MLRWIERQMASGAQILAAMPPSAIRQALFTI
jgi:hypothetical protein